MRLPTALLVCLVLLAAGCRSAPAAREYALVGQVIRVDRDAGQITIRHEDIQGFMPGMTMPFTVRDRTLLDGREPGDLVEATLMVDGIDAWLSRITKTGHAPLPEAAAPAQGLAPGDRVPDAAFTDQDGAPLDLGWLDGRPAVVTFIYTRCPLPDFCPAIDARFAALQRAILADRTAGGLGRARLLSVTIDPGFDTPAVLKAHAARRGADPAVWRFATASPEAIASFGRQFGLDVRQTGEGPADIEHNLRTIVLDSDRRIVEMLTGSGWTASQVVARLAAAGGA